MNVNELYSFCLKTLKEADIEDADFDCDCLFNEFSGLNKIKRIIEPYAEISQEACDKIFSAVNRRACGEPLQYILGKWEFMGFEFTVGKGVLIPRPETELLVELADNYIKSHKIKTVYDLCAGSGAIGLTLAKLNPMCKVYLFEKYDEAFKYLKINSDNLKLENVKLIKCDIFDFHNSAIENADLIVSNPPYIKSEEISLLQKEVGFEPKTALDGGHDGLDFYRCIKEKWFGRLNCDGTFLFECGDGQAEDIVSYFSDICSKSSVYFDFNNIDRVVEINV